MTASAHAAGETDGRLRHRPQTRLGGVVVPRENREHPEDTQPSTDSVDQHIVEVHVDGPGWVQHDELVPLIDRPEQHAQRHRVKGGARDRVEGNRQQRVLEEVHHLAAQRDERQVGDRHHAQDQHPPAPESTNAIDPQDRDEHRSRRDDPTEQHRQVIDAQSDDVEVGTEHGLHHIVRRHGQRHVDEYGAEGEPRASVHPIQESLRH